jgi:hypothetical protein
MELRFLARTTNHAYRLDAVNGNSYWADAIKKEIDSLLVDEEVQQSSFHPDFLDDYDGAKEEIGTGFPNPYGS